MLDRDTSASGSDTDADTDADSDTDTDSDTSDPDQPFLTEGWAATSEQDRAYFGWSVSSAGDVNGDGYGDVVVGAPYFDNGEPDAGTAYLYLGSATGLETTAAWTAELGQASACFGSSVSSAGDVNGDGYGDVVVGAPYFDNGKPDAGKAYVYLGSAGGLETTAAWTAESHQEGAYFGSSVASAGDVNTDGYDDVLVGAPYFDIVNSNEGQVYLYLGSATGLGTNPAWTAESDQDGAYFGSSVASAGDVNHDGYDDVVVGAPWNAHKAYLYLGSASLALGPTPAWTAESDQATGYFGASVSSAGDVNSDGYADVLVGAPREETVSGGTGKAYLYFGSALGLGTSAAWTAELDKKFAAFGNSVSSAADVNDDGYDDVVIGAGGYSNGESFEGAAYVYLGSATGLEANEVWMAESDQNEAAFGCSVSSAGDVDGDGYGDLLVGAPYFNSTTTDDGSAFLYRGG